MSDAGLTLRFLGANRQVTGSRYLLEAGGLRLMIDCGLFQEREFQARNWEEPPVDPASVDTLLLTHAHLDHCGLIPRFVRQGYGNPVLTTQPSIALTRLILRDAARIQEEDAAFKRQRHAREGRSGPRPVVPLYSVGDAEDALKLLRAVPYGEPVALNDRVSVVYHDAGHILGSALLDVRVRDGAAERRVVFSGDVGQWDKPLVRDPTLLDAADYVVMESTYGDREHEKTGEVEDVLAEAINETAAAGGNLLIPTFALERAQELLFHLGRLLHAKRVPRLMVFLDSPMAVNATRIFRDHAALLDEETQRLMRAGRSPLHFPALQLSRTRDQSKAINHIRGSCIILAGSGMCTGGRIKHHLAQNLERPESMVLFTGYQARGTLGREILDGADQVRVLGRHQRVRAKVRRVFGMSAHADRSDLLRWLGHFDPPPRRVFLTHGDEEAALALAATIESQGGPPVEVPQYGDAVAL